MSVLGYAFFSVFSSNEENYDPNNVGWVLF